MKHYLSIACLLLFNAVVFAQDPELVRRFDYDAKAPLDLKIISSQKRGDVTVYDVTYASPKGGVVPAYLIVPATGKGPFALSGVDHRFKAFVLMTGSISDEVIRKTGGFEQFRRQVGPETFDAYMASHVYLDEGKFVSHAAPATVFLQYATQEPFLTPDVAREFEKVVSEPKRFKLYDAPHALNAEARRDRIAFLTEQLKLKPLRAQVIDAIPDLFQPAPPN